jgi:3-isopropylmalate/(R)-2-methylmalate dehydratase small subunit
MKPFLKVSGIAFAMREDDVNTDLIAPLSMARVLHPDYADLLFKRRRVDEQGKRVPEHPLNQERFRDVSIFVGGRNFGCGSGREAAVWCLAAIGVRCVVSRGFADLFRENCLQGGVLPIMLQDPEANRLEEAVLTADGRAPFSVDLSTQFITGPGDIKISFDISASDRSRLMEGLDAIGLTLKYERDIGDWERSTLAQRPWMQAFRDKRL